MSYPLDRLHEEVAFMAYYFHWSLEEIVTLPHAERIRWCQEISNINRKVERGGTDANGATTTHRSLSEF